MAPKPKKSNAVEKDLHTLEKIVITYLDVDQVTPNTYNPNRQSDKDFELLCRSISEDGFTQPIIVQKEGYIIVDGEHRWRACKAIGWAKVPCVLVEMTQAQQLVSTLRHNRARGNENVARAADVLKDLETMGALDHAQESLLMDDVEMKLFLDSIPRSELNLREEGVQMSAEDVKEQLRQEQALQNQMHAEDSAKASIEKVLVMSLSLKISPIDRKQITQALSDIAPGKPVNEQILILMEAYKDDPAAQEAIHA